MKTAEENKPIILIRPLQGHPLSLPITLHCRSAQEVLGQAIVGTTDHDADGVLLNHPPTYLVHEAGGEELLNRESVMAQLGLNDSITAKRANIPNFFITWQIDAKSLQDITVKILRYLMGPIQILNYRKSDAFGNKLSESAINLLETDRNLSSEVKHKLFDTTTLRTRHLKVLLSSANLQERTLRNLGKKLKEGSSGGSEKEHTLPINKDSGRKKRQKRSHRMQEEEHHHLDKTEHKSTNKIQKMTNLSRRASILKNAAEKAETQLPIIKEENH